jgi:hypothetical protein
VLPFSPPPPSPSFYSSFLRFFFSRIFFKDTHKFLHPLIVSFLVIIDVEDATNIGEENVDDVISIGEDCPGGHNVLAREKIRLSKRLDTCLIDAVHIFFSPSTKENRPLQEVKSSQSKLIKDGNVFSESF